MKKFLSAFLAAIMVLSTVACSDSGGGTSSAGSSSSESSSSSSASESSEQESSQEEAFSGTITIACGSLESEAFNQILPEYQKTNPDVNLDIVVTKDVTDFETMMTGWIASDSLPDMYVAQVGAVEQGYAANGYLEPLPAEITDRLIEGDTELISYNDQIYAFPMSLSISVMFVNNGVLKEAGIDLNEENYPKCWSEFLDLCQQCVDHGIEKPVGIAGKDASEVTAWTFQYIYQSIYGQNPNWYADILRGEAAWNDDLYLGMFEKYAEMLPYISDDALGVDADGNRKRFITGEAPIFFQTANSLGNIRLIDPEADILLLPSCFTDSPEDQTLISGFDNAISITTSAKNKDLCFDFLDYVTSEEGATIFNTVTTYQPTTKENNTEMDPAFDLVYKILSNDELPNSPILSRQWIPGIKEIMKTGQQNWFAGEDAKEVADQIQEEHTRLMEADPEWVENFLASYVEK